MDPEIPERQTLSYLVPALSHLVPNPVTSCTTFVTPCTQPCWAAIGASRRPAEGRPFCELIQKGVNLNSKNRNGNMPLHLATACGQESILEALLENGAKIDDKDSSQLTPLQIAVLCEHLSVTKVLLKHGADTEVKSKLGYSPLHCAICEGNASLVKLLLEHGADVNSPADNGLTPLIRTICGKDHGAKPDIRVRSGPAVHYAIIEDDKKTFQMSLKYGSSLTIKNDYGESPLENALDYKLEFLKIISFHQH